MVFARRDLETQTTVLLPEVSDPHRVTWLPDSKRFIALTRGRFELYSSEGTLIRHFDTDSVATRIGGVSPNGRYLAYLKNNPAGSGFATNFNIWLLDLRSGEHVQVTRDDGFKGIPAWSRDGKAVYYTYPLIEQHLYKKTIGSDEAPEQITFYNNANVFHPLVLQETGELTFALVSGTSTVLTAPANAPEMAREILGGYAPMAGPDGKTIYFLKYGGDEGGLWSMTQDGASPKHLLSEDELWAAGKSLSPDGSQLAYVLGLSEGTVLYTMPSSGGTPKRLYVSEDGYGAPAWSPDSKELAFADGPDLKVMAASGGSAHSIARAGSWQSDEIAWSPDGKYVAGFAYSEDRRTSVLHIVNRQTGESMPLSTGDEQTYKEGLSWHPEGDRISYITSSDSTGMEYKTRIASLTGGPVATLFHGSEGFENYWGAWGPDGRYYFMETGGAGFDIFVYPDDETKARPFIQPRGDRDIWPLPSWSSDGSVITWSEGSSRTQIWSVTDRK
ncbi:MAG: Tol biopolymer transport system component [Thalassolituus oleivorans]|jgi:Tol biopolymer transport system component